MLELAKNSTAFKAKLASFMEENGYDAPMNIEDIDFDSEGRLLFPCLVEFVDRVRPFTQERRVFVKACSKKDAKSLVYFKTNRNTETWVRHRTISSYEKRIEMAKGDLSDDHIIYPDSNSLLEILNDKTPFLSSSINYKKHDSQIWMKIFLLTLSQAKEFATNISR